MDWWTSTRWRDYERVSGVITSRADVLRSAHWLTRVIDLDVDREYLWQGVRKSYRSLIRRASERYEIVYCASDVMSAFERMHERVSGRQTRSSESWRMMREWVQSGHLLLVGARDSDRWVAFAAFEIWHDWAYYGHAASEVRDVSHALIWAAMNELKSRGVRVLELGWQHEATDEKGRAIEFFRRGFGGRDTRAAEVRAHE